MKKTKEWLLYNAVLTWVFHYGDRQEANVDDSLVEQYRQLQKELESEQSNNTKTQKRGRPAKRQRTKKAASNPSSTEKSEKIPYENQKEVDAYMKQRSNQEA